MIVFLSCVSMKNDKRCKAKDMYISSLFEKSYEYAQTLNPDKIYILSAKHHVLELDEMIDPYNLTLNDMSEKERRKWAHEVIRQCYDKGIDFDDEVIFLCGINYRKYIVRNFKNALEPVAGLPIGKQLKYYTEQIKLNKSKESE